MTWLDWRAGAFCAHVPGVLQLFRRPCIGLLLPSLGLVVAGCEAKIATPTGPQGPSGPSGPTGASGTPRPWQQFECKPDLRNAPELARRLTQFEWQRTIESTFGIQAADIAIQLPSDQRADGFSNTAQSLVVTLDHIEAYDLAAAQVIERIDVAGWIAEHASCTEDTAECRTGYIESAGTRIYRSTIDATETTALLAIFDVVTTEGGDFSEGAQIVLQAMLQSPRFLYRVESQRGSGTQEVSPADLANRLSYLVWAAPPDQELLEAAASGRLSRTMDIEREVRRMLQSPQAVEASVRFASDWLHLDRLDVLARDPNRFPNWDAALARSMKDETQDFFTDVAWTRALPLMAIFDEQSTVVSDRLAAHYGIDTATVVEGRRDLSGVAERGGLLTQGSLHTIGGDDSSMVTRGLYVLENVLCGHLDSPPPGVDTTPPEVVPGNSQRSYSEGRVASSSCGGCHEQMEPLAWGLERFDATGIYRTSDDQGNALLQDGWIQTPGSSERFEFDDVASMMRGLRQSDRVRDCLTVKVAQFSMGRVMSPADACALAEIRTNWEASDKTYADLLVALATSPLIRMTETEAP